MGQEFWTRVTSAIVTFRRLWIPSTRETITTGRKPASPASSAHQTSPRVTSVPARRSAACPGRTWTSPHPWSMRSTRRGRACPPQLHRRHPGRTPVLTEDERAVLAGLPKARLLVRESLPVWSCLYYLAGPSTVNGMLSVFKNARADSGTSTSPVAQVLNEKRPAKMPKARRSASAFGKRTGIIIPILADYRDAFKPIGNRDDSRGGGARLGFTGRWRSRLGSLPGDRGSDISRM